MYFIIVILMACFYLFGVKRAKNFILHGNKPSSISKYHGYYAVASFVIPVTLLLLVWLFLEKTVVHTVFTGSLPESIKNNSFQYQIIDIEVKKVIALIASGEFNSQEYIGNLIGGENSAIIASVASKIYNLTKIGFILKLCLVFVVAIFAIIHLLRKIDHKTKVHYRIESIFKVLLFLSSLLSVVITFAIILSLLFEAVRFFKEISIFHFLFTTEWSPESTDFGGEPKFGFIPLLTGTLLISFIAVVLSSFIGITSAIYMSEYMHSTKRKFVKPLLEILAGIPTVVYGFFAVVVIGPTFVNLAAKFGVTMSLESALSAGIVMGLMITPFMSSITDDVLQTIPNYIREGAIGLGSTKSEMILKILLPSSISGIVSAMLLATSRAIGETMIVVMAAGLAANLTVNPLDSVTTITTQIVMLLQGDQESDSLKTLAAFALSAVLLVFTLVINLIGIIVVKKYKRNM